MKKVSRVWLWLFLVLFGYSGGIITGVVVDVDTVYHTTVKKLKQKHSPGGEIIVDITNEPTQSKREIRKEDRTKKRSERKQRKNNAKGE